ncbi:helix-turn-helix transcriptional regulator [Actinomyces sp. B33]|uniref:helix-turn-helix transcriptional regulator n=1 Tax=Actinomyces sp. B33 TaxID=2942131 RepID=UPI002342508B|nr:transcriptional regulator [Actinomyces sp. B33]MDC4233587.1 helix-turn-helix transcriptional regulator [Actinomyces sp. B33]
MPTDAAHDQRGQILNALAQLVAPLAQAVPGRAEVVLHDLSLLPNSIIAIDGDLTGRKPGDPATDLLLEQIASGRFETRIGYRTISPTGRHLRSTTIVIPDPSGLPIAALCLNCDITDWTAIATLVRSIVEGIGEESSASDTPVPAADEISDQPPVLNASPIERVPRPSNARDSEAFVHDVDELAAHLLRQAVEEQGLAVDDMRKEHKLRAVASLKRRGFFLLRDAAETAAAALGVTRFTIYNYLNELGEDQ